MLELLAFYGIYFLIGLWATFGAWYLRKRSKKPNAINEYLADAIPSVFTTLGVLGTFIGIAYGLLRFDVDTMDESIPKLLDGLKTAFISSIVGISLSLIYSRVGDYVVKNIERKQPPRPSDELSALQDILKELKEAKEARPKEVESIVNAVSGDGDRSLATHLTKFRGQLKDQLKDQHKELTQQFDAIASSLGGDDDTSLLTQIQRLRSDQEDQAKTNHRYSEIIIEALGGDQEYSMLSQLTALRNEQQAIGLKANENTEQIILAMRDNNAAIQQKFKEFTELLAKNNTEALVEAMQRVITDFNAQMNELIQRLVKENFEELNQSVQRLNTWQQENKAQVAALVDQFREVSQNLQISSQMIQEIAANTKQLTDENSHLKKLIKELQEVMMEDTKFKQITEKVGNTVDTLHQTTQEFEGTTNKLNQWVRDEKSFKDSVDILISRLQEIEKIKDQNGEFWQQTRTSMNEGVQILEGGNRALREEVDNLNTEFYQRLNDTFVNLDTLIRRYIQNGTQQV